MDGPLLRVHFHHQVSYFISALILFFKTVEANTSFSYTCKSLVIFFWGGKFYLIKQMRMFITATSRPLFQQNAENWYRTCKKKKKNDLVTNICVTDNRALLLYKTTIVSVEIKIIFCHLYYFLVTITIVLVTETK